MHHDLKLAIQLQEVDIRLSELTGEIAALPKHIAEIERRLESHQRKLDADRAALAANQRDRKKLDGDIQIQEQKTSKLRNQMLEAKTNEQYRAFQHEITFCETEIRKAEDRILDLMGESEPLEKNVKAAEEALKLEKTQVEKEKVEARTRTEKDKALVAQFQAERSRLVARIGPAVLSHYERLRKMRAGIAISEAVEGRCSRCHMALRLQFFQDLKKGDQVMSCESCGRLLFYNPPVAVEELGEAPLPPVAGK